MADTVLVTGGGGFVGAALCKKLLQDGYQVRSLARGNYPDLVEKGVEFYRCDLSKDVEVIESSLKGVSCVFHTAANVELWGPYKDFYESNVVATSNIIEACKKTGVKQLVFTSSPSVIADGSDLNGVDESTPYPDHYRAFYPMTKAIAEKMVIAANTADFHTVALRPHLIFGPGDTGLEPLIVEKAKKGRLIQIGSGKNIVDFCYIDDCVAAHINAMNALTNNSNCRGKVYFISQGIPIPLWEWINTVLIKNNIQPLKKKVPVTIATTLGSVFEFLSRYSPIPFDPPFTRFLAEEMSTNHYFNISAAKKDLGYTPRKSNLFEW